METSWSSTALSSVSRGTSSRRSPIPSWTMEVDGVTSCDGWVCAGVGETLCERVRTRVEEDAVSEL
jgi:hypothetical protein